MYSTVGWAYKDPLTVQKLTQMVENTIRTSEHRIYGVECMTTGTSTVIIKGGRMELAGSWLTETATQSLTAENAAHWEEGVSQEGSSTCMYVVAYPSGNGFGVKFRASAPAYSDTNSSTACGDKFYDNTGSTWFRYIGAVYNDSGNSIVKYQQRGNWVYYDNPGSGMSALEATPNGTDSGFTGTYSLYPKVPRFSYLTKLNVQGRNVTIQAVFKSADATISGTVGMGVAVKSPASQETITTPPIPLDSSQQLKFASNAGNTIDSWVNSYYIGNIRGH